MDLVHLQTNSLTQARKFVRPSSAFLVRPCTGDHGGEMRCVVSRVAPDRLFQVERTDLAVPDRLFHFETRVLGRKKQRWQLKSPIGRLWLGSFTLKRPPGRLRRGSFTLQRPLGCL